MDSKSLLRQLTGSRVTARRVAQILKVSEKTARSRLASGLSAADLITVCRALGVNPVEALVELQYLTAGEVAQFAGAAGKGLSEIGLDELVMELVDRTVSTQDLLDLAHRQLDRLADTAIR